jgi:hypothetical protein
MRKYLLLLTLTVLVFSCAKESSLETGNPPPGTGGGGGTGGGTGTCNNTVMKLKKMQALFQASDSISMSWTAGGAVDKIVMNLQLSDYLTAKYIYQNNRIQEAVLLDQNNNNAIVDTVVFRYNVAGKVDSMYRKGGGFDRSLKYDAAGKLVKITRHDNGGIMYYWTIVTDTKGNITKAEEWWDDGAGGFEKLSSYTYTRDAKKNPFDGLAVYMLDLDDEYAIFRLWGANNNVDQTYTDPSLGLSLVTGMKFKYNANCYPATSQNTISGQALFPDDDWQFLYY